MSQPRSPAELLGELDAFKQQHRRRALLLTVLPLIAIAGVYVVLALRVAQSSQRLVRQEDEIQKASAQLSKLHAQLDEERKDLRVAQQQRAELDDANKELEASLSAQQKLRVNLESTFAQDKPDKLKLEEARELVVPDQASKRARAVSAWNEGYRAFNAGQVDKAAKLYQEATRIDPSYAPAVNSLGRLAFEQGELNEAAKLYTDAAKLDPSYVPTLHNRALLATKLDSHDLAEARRLNSEALKLRPKYEPALALKAWLDQQEKGAVRAK